MSCRRIQLERIQMILHNKRSHTRSHDSTKLLFALRTPRHRRSEENNHRKTKQKKRNQNDCGYVLLIASKAATE